jgi:hypothetical protein
VINISGPVRNGIPPPQVSSKENACVDFSKFWIVKGKSGPSDEILIIEDLSVVVPVFSRMGTNQCSVAISGAGLLQKWFHKGLVV